MDTHEQIQNCNIVYIAKHGFVSGCLVVYQLAAVRYTRPRCFLVSSCSAMFDINIVAPTWMKNACLFNAMGVRSRDIFCDAH